MSKFEKEGVDRQYGARDKKQAIKAFRFSCSLCCSIGRQKECKHCAIASAHKDVTEIIFA